MASRARHSIGDNQSNADDRDAVLESDPAPARDSYPAEEGDAEEEALREAEAALDEFDPDSATSAEEVAAYIATSRAYYNAAEAYARKRYSGPTLEEQLARFSAARASLDAAEAGHSLPPDTNEKQRSRFAKLQLCAFLLLAVLAAVRFARDCGN